MWRRGWRAFKQALRLYTQRKAHHWAATITLFSFTLLFPITIFITVSMQTIEAQSLIHFLSLWMPEEAARGVAGILAQARVPRAVDVILSLLVIIWGLSHIIHSIIEISDDFYGYHKRHFWHRRMLALATLVILLFWQFITMTVYTLITVVGRRILQLNLFPGPDYMVYLVHWGSTLLLITLQAVSLVLIYAMAGPDFRWRRYLPGGVFTAVLGWMATRILVNYTRVVPIQDIYGAVTNIVIFILWVYWESTIFIIGIGVNRSWFPEDPACERVVS